MVAAAHVHHPHLCLTHPQPFLLRGKFQIQILVKKIIYLVEPGLVGHLSQSPPDDEHLWTLLSNFELMEPDEKKEGKSRCASFLLLVTDVVGNVFNEEQDGRPEFH